MSSDTVVIDLVALIEQVIDQVWGSDERMLLQQWLERNTEEQQPVTVELAQVIVEQEG